MTTTIKVSNEVRDRLKVQAAASNRTLGAHLEYLAALGERRARMQHLQAAIRSTSAADLESYRAEARAWEQLDA